MPYPQTIDDEAELVDGSSPLSASDLNSIRNSVIAVERELGIIPSSTFGTVSDRLGSIVQPALSAENIPTDAAGPFSGASVEQVLRQQYVFSNLGRDRYLFVCIDVVAEKTYNVVLNSPLAGTIQSISIETDSGTCDVSFLIDSIELDNFSVSSLRQTSNYFTDNLFSPGSEVLLSVSNLVEPIMLKITIAYSV